MRVETSDKRTLAEASSKAPTFSSASPLRGVLKQDMVKEHGADRR